MSEKYGLITAYTDGACRGNPGRGGYGAIIVYGDNEKVISGGAENTTNNRMEISGVIAALSALVPGCRVKIVTDSRYVVDSMTKGWAESWRKNGWKKADKKPALNSDLWETLLSLCAERTVTFEWVEGHAGHPYNERCDRLATSYADGFAH